MARLRIIAGEFGGRFINADVAKVTHPMGDRVRSAMFASLMSRNVLPGAKVLDAFAGTGAIGLEALSRGAQSVIFLEKDRVAARVIADNIETLGVADRAKVINTTVSNWLTTRDKTDEFDLIFADPPYNKPQFSTVFRLPEALKANGGGDVLIETQEAIVKRSGLFLRKIKSVTVTGYPATYKNFRNVDEQTLKKALVNGTLKNNVTHEKKSSASIFGFLQ